MKRIISAVLILGIFISVIEFKNQILFFIFSNIILTLALIELFNMFEKKEISCFKKIGIMSGFLVSLCFFFNSKFFIILTGLIGILFISLVRINFLKNDLYKKISNTVFCILYIQWLGSHIILIQNNNNQELIYLIFFIVCTNDTMAYYIGKYYGKHHLAPKISPKKTIEGSVAGIGGGIIGALFIKSILFNSIWAWPFILLGIIGSLLGQAGDLFESFIKRSLGQKDSGNIIPGHGGVLDRIDNCLLTLPIIYYILFFNFISL